MSKTPTLYQAACAFQIAEANFMIEMAQNRKKASKLGSRCGTPNQDLFLCLHGRRTYTKK